MAEAVKVIVKLRPMNEKEKAMKCKSIVRIEECKVYLEPLDKKAPEKAFLFDSAYDGAASNETIYSDICYSLVESVLEGYNSTIFAYGQTGCGKSYTMQGPVLSSLVDKLDSDRIDVRMQGKNNGIISNSFEHLFEAISVTTDIRYLVLVSYLEIYNENIRDLLSNGGSSNNLKLKELPSEGVIVENLSKHAVHNVAECENLLLLGSKNRKTGSTLMNAGSSRSHSIFIIHIEQISKEASKGEDGGENSIRKGKLNLVDLAGSERQSKTGATGETMKEATKINLSLSALGNVISALVDGNKNKHVPYRDSKLTRLLQDSLGGNTKTLMISCISPADYNYEETLSTLRYASRAKNIKNKPRINEDPKDAMLREYQQEITELRKRLEGTAMGRDFGAFDQVDVQEQIQKEKRKIEQEYEEKAEQLKLDHHQHQNEKNELIRSMELLKQEYETKLQSVVQTSLKNDQTENEKLQKETEITERIKSIKGILIGGERANDTQLKEKRFKKKLASQKKIGALNSIINRLEQCEEKDLLQAHYSDIHQELLVKTDYIKQQRHKIKSFEREIIDIQGEFELDRADYLETIRRLEKDNNFFKQFYEKVTPILRRDGRMWNLDNIKSESTWNDDSKKWKIPDDMILYLKLPPAHSPLPSSRESLTSNGRESTSLTAPARLENPLPIDTPDYESRNDSSESDLDMALNYFRPKRAAELIHQSRSWKDMGQRNTGQKAFNISLSVEDNDPLIMNKTWYGGGSKNYFKSDNSYYKKAPNNQWNLNFSNKSSNHHQNMW